MVTGRQLQALPADQHAQYWNQARDEQACRVARQFMQTPDRDLRAEFLELLGALSRPVSAT